MDFALTEEQEALRSTARDLLARECPRSLVRARYADPHARADALWKHAVAAGWTDLDVVELCLVLEECGRVLAPIPLWETLGLALPLLAGADADAVRAGSSTATALTAPGHAPEAHAVDLVVGATGAAEPLLSIDHTRVVCAVDGAVLTDDTARDIAIVTLCADTLGAARWVLDETVAYAKTRVQFERPIGSFQAIAHKLADQLLAFERAWAATYDAVMRVAANDAAGPRAAAVAKAVTGEAARGIARAGVQVHGGIGFTWEHDLHLFVRRIYGNEALLGTTDHHHTRVATFVLD